MARIAKSEHTTIQRLVEVEQRKVPEVAAEYGCTPANIYAILTRLRRPNPTAANDATPMPAPVISPPPEEIEIPAPPTAAAPTVQAPLALFEPAAPKSKSRPPRDGQKRRAAAAEPDQPTLPAPDATPLLTAVKPPPPVAVEPPAAGPMAVETPAPRPAARAAVAPKSRLKSGYGLCTRSPEGDDSITPFRSLEDLLSAVKPILRASANNPEPVWFSIQPVDLADIDLETL